MSAPNPTTTNGTASYEQAQRQGTTGNQADRVDAPDRDALSQGAQDLLRLQEDVTDRMRSIYQHPEEAYRRLTELDEEGVARFREDPSEIGPLRQGVEPTQETVSYFVEARESHSQSQPADRDAVQAITDQTRAYEAQDRGSMAQYTTQQDSLRNALDGAMGMSHHYSI